MRGIGSQAVFIDSNIPMISNGIEMIVTADRHFDHPREVKRLNPMTMAASFR